MCGLLTLIYFSWSQIFFQYPEGHVSKSMYAVFKLVSGTTSCKLLEDFIPNLGLAIWTTTPWTIPANAGKLFIPATKFFFDFSFKILSSFQHFRFDHFSEGG